MKPKQFEHPIIKDTVRPFRLLDPRKKKHLRWRCYAYHDVAIEGAWRELQWPGSPAVIEVYDITRGAHIATLTRERGGKFTRWVHKDWNFRRAPAHATKAPPTRSVPVVAQETLQ